MKARYALLTTLGLGLGLTLALLWALGGPPVARAQPPWGRGVAPGGNCGPSPPGPCYASVQAAVDAAGTGDEILIASGVYTGVQARAGVTQVVIITKTLTLRGGYTTTNWTTPDPVANPTTLDAERQGRVVYITADVTPTVEGLRITGGDGSTGGDGNGGGIAIQEATAIIRNNVISGNDEDGIQLIDYSDLSDRFILIEHNFIANNAMVGLGLMDNGDTSEDYRAASIPERIHVFNNTFSGNPYGLTGGDNLIALNNLFVNSINIAMKQVDGNSIAAYNLFWNNGTDEQGSNLDLASTLFADPLLDFELRLQPGSPAIDAGTSLFQWQGETVLDMPDTGFSGVAPDLGAYESDS